MRRVVSAACVAALLCGCATPPSTEPGKGSGAAYVPMVDMEGVAPTIYALDVDACRAAAQKMRVMRVGPSNSEVVDAVAVGVAIVFPMGIVAAAAIGGIAAAVGDSPDGVPADPRMQQTALVNCMARKGYRNLDPNVTVTYAAPPKPDPQSLPRRTGLDTYVAEKFAKANNCSATPRAVLEDKGPGFERYSVACADGQSMTLRCEFGNCTQQVASGN
ncbi:hypothetical protein QTH90_09430 [Variovorax sp. J2P1-59]|uniref:hypothetical protein n=1 Tax=Variovorax flavidus TaxID=3053501 RepID=UPI00257619FF|nr:hypothetical protein [Variovorax sp. J2P1-59]MDM0074600.1 hypothetical protein [Variovorax sp. J2P1-59]